MLYFGGVTANSKYKFMDLDAFKQAALRTDYTSYEDFHTGDVSARLDYATMGLVTEATKVLDIVKKTKKNIQPLDREKVKEELGDIVWYLNLTLDELDFSFDEILQATLDKIDRKYPKDDLEKTKLIRNK